MNVDLATKQDILELRQDIFAMLGSICKPAEIEEAISTAQAMKILGIKSYETLKHYVNDGLLTVRRIGKCNYYLRSEINNLLK